MKWISQDIDLYLKAKEYIDTAVIPLIPLSFGDDMKQAASMSEFITLIAAFLERQFTGRILLLPPFVYLTTDHYEKRLEALQTWTTVLKSNQFKHIFFLTSDTDWKIENERFDETLVWIPALSLDDLHESQKYSIVDSQVSQILSLFTKQWHKNELT